MSERRAHLLMQRGSETLRRSTGSLFACIVMHPMRNARSCAAVMAMGSWKQPDERCYIEQPWAPSLGTKMTPGERTDRKSCLSFRANFPNLESVGKCRSNIALTYSRWAPSPQAISILKQTVMPIGRFPSIRSLKGARTTDKKQKKRAFPIFSWRLEIVMIKQFSFIKKIIIKTLVKGKITIDYLKGGKTD